MKPRGDGFFAMVAFFAAMVSMLFLGPVATAQFTIMTGTGLPNLKDSYVAWSDFDKDGYLDAMVVGSPDPEPLFDWTKFVARVYHNNGNGTFTDINAKLDGVAAGTGAWGDYDNDGYPDIILGGVDTLNNQITRLYHNNGNGTFTENVKTVFHSSSYGSVAWGDYNNDGYLDVLLSGFNAGTPIAKLYRNNKDGSFTEVTTAVLVGMNGHSRVAWADYDNDGYADILVSGRTTTSAVNPLPATKLYRNVGGTGTFTEVSTAGFVGVWRGSVVWGDYNNDGYLDLAVSGLYTGVDSLGNSRDTTVLYQNNGGNGTFTPVTTAAFDLPATSYGAMAWGDFDGDGYLDLLIKGYNSNAGLFRNLSGSGWFASASLGPPEMGLGGAAWGDFNNDGYLDILVNGLDNVTGRDTTLLYRYNGPGSSAAFAANVKPSAPTGLTATAAGDSAVLLWRRGSDSKTPAIGLSYNLRVGTTPTGIQALSPLADTASGASNGYRRVTALGNMNLDTTATLKKLGPGKYYWWVQTLDNTFAGSAFSSRGFFAFPYTITASAGPNGTITPSGPVSVMPDSSKRFSIKPANNYRVDSLIVDGVRVPSDTAYTFSAVAANHTIRATFTVLTRLVSIAEARKDLDRNGIPDHLGDTLAVVGIVNSVNIQTTNFGYFIQDSSAGIHVFRSGLTGAPTLRPGYRVAVSGKIDYFRGTTEIVPFDLASDIVVVDTGNTITAIPLSISSLKANPEVYESRRIVLDVVQPAGFTSAQWPAAGASANLNVWNGKDSLVLRIDGDTEVDGSPYPSFPARVTGVATQFTSSTTINNDGYQITPMFISDFVGVNAPPLRYFGLMVPANGSRLLVDTVGTRQYKFRWHRSVDFNNNRLTYTFQPVGLSGLPSDSSGVDTVKTLTGAALRAYLGAADSLNFKWTVLVKDSLNPAVACIDTFSVVLKKVLVGVSEAPSGIPAVFALSQNYPNPFNPSTTIRYALPQRSHVSLSVYNALGQNIFELVNREEESGYHEVRFDAANLASGVYFYRIQAGSFVETKKLMLLR